MALKAGWAAKAGLEWLVNQATKVLLEPKAGADLAVRLDTLVLRVPLDIPELTASTVSLVQLARTADQVLRADPELKVSLALSELGVRLVFRDLKAKLVQMVRTAQSKAPEVPQARMVLMA